MDALTALERLYWAGGEDKGSGPIAYSLTTMKGHFLWQRTQFAKAKSVVTSLFWSVTLGSFFQSDAPLSSC